MIRLYVLLPAILLTACSGNKGPNKFSDPTIIEIYNLKDRRSGDSLKVYLTSENPVYRREAALAFASVQDSTAARRISGTESVNAREIKESPKTVP